MNMKQHFLTIVAIGLGFQKENNETANGICKSTQAAKNKIDFPTHLIYAVPDRGQDGTRLKSFPQLKIKLAHIEHSGRQLFQFSCSQAIPAGFWNGYQLIGLCKSGITVTVRF